MEHTLHRRQLLVVLPLLAVTLMGQGCAIRVKRGPSDGGVYRSADGGSTWEQKVFVGVSKKTTITISNLDVARLAVSPADARLVLAVAGAGGVYATGNEGDSWQQVFKQSVQAVAFHPQERDTWYVASTNRVYRTDDAGGSWRELYLETTPEAAISDIAVDQTKPETIYAVTTKGVFLMSDDEGLTWQKRYAFPSGIVKAFINPRDTRILYAAAATGALWRSADKGETWADLSERIRDTAEVKRFGGYQAMQFIPGRPDALLYATSYALFRSFNSGADWEVVPLVTPPGAVTITGLACDPASEQNVWYAAGAALYRTKDAGLSWETLRLPSTRSATALTAHPTDSSIMYLGFTRTKK